MTNLDAHQDAEIAERSERRWVTISVIVMIVLPLMLFHQIQLMICATLARRYLSQRGVSGDVLEHRYPTTGQNVVKMNITR